MSNEMDLEALHGFLDESVDSMQGIEADFIDLEKDPANLEIINRIFRPIHSLKGNSGFFGLTNINKFSHRLENLLDNVRNGELVITKEIIDTLLGGADYLRQMVERAYNDPTDTVLREDENDFLGKVEQFKPEKPAGTIASVLTLQKLLQEAMDNDISPEENTLISNLLSKIEKTNKEIELLISDAKSSDASAKRSVASSYMIGDENYTETLKPLLDVASRMDKKTPVDRDLQQKFSNTLTTLKELFKDDSDAAHELEELQSMCNFLDDALLISSKEFTSSTSKSIDAILNKFEVIETAKESSSPESFGKLGEILIAQAKVSPEQLTEALKKQKKVGEILVEDGVLKDTDLKEALTIQQKNALDEHNKKAAGAREVKKTIRIDQDKLDSFANFVGELFINIDSFSFLKKQLEEAEVDFDIMARFTNTITSLDEMVDTLQESIMGIRKVPIDTLFKRFPRVIRQLAGSLNKNIDFRIVGEDTVIDKDLLEKIENPLVHMLRNSVDHGIEMPEDRANNNKPTTGTLELKASVDENYFYITITDDGKGMDPQTIKNVAIKKNFLTEDEANQLSDKELINLIFKPGFSSAENISDVSGRGVGMDVVQSVLKETQGTVEVDSVINQGTKVLLKIPLTKTLVAKEAMIVSVYGRTLAVPSEDITATIEAKEEEATKLFSGDNCIQYHGSVYQVIDLGAFLFPKSTQQRQDSDRHVIIVCEKHNIALWVDEVLSHQKIVVKNFSGGYNALQNIRGINGFTILGNEDIILIADVQKITEESDD
ncbi:MAG: chemotaxis protein CheA [Desulfobulbaceae bacterium]|nr:chemotaxis protein CheA [Desulfobulbaceae bacterium]